MRCGSIVHREVLFEHVLDNAGQAGRFSLATLLIVRQEKVPAGYRVNVRGAK